MQFGLNRVWIKGCAHRQKASAVQLVRDAIAALVKQTGAIEQAAVKLGISDLNPDTADHSF